MKKILYISHECSATGAPILFLQIIEYINSLCLFDQVDILCIKPGERNQSFEALGRYWLCPSEGELRATILNEVDKAYDVIYTNTVETAHILPLLSSSGALTESTHVVSHIHELDGTIDMYGSDKLEYFKTYASEIICVSEAVAKNFAKYGFDLESIHIVYPFVDGLQVTPQDNLESEVFNILACAEITVGKGVDVLINTARELQQIATRPFKFTWVGADNHKILSYFLTDLNRLGLEAVVEFVGFKDDVTPYFSHADLFFMCSRQDSFPLVCLEAASIKKPVMYFPDAGGINELLGEDAGLPINYLDYKAAAQKINDVMGRLELLEQVGILANQQWSENFTKDISLKKIKDIVLPF